jgi:hypothetical protein
MRAGVEQEQRVPWLWFRAAGAVRLAGPAVPW